MSYIVKKKLKIKYQCDSQTMVTVYLTISIEDPVMCEIRYLDKLVDELAKGKKMDKILRHEK